MTTTRKAIVFLAWTFALSWGFAIGGWAAGAHRQLMTGVVALVLMMTGPAVAALICALAFEKGRRIEALGLRFKLNWWWLGAWLMGLALAALSVAATLLLSDRTLTDPLVNVRAMIEATGQDASQLDTLPSHVGVVIILQAVSVGALINALLLTFTEELGWRGYLHHLWRPSGFWRASLATGFVWGLWHAPAVYFYGLNYPEYPAYGIGVFILWCMMVSPIMTLVRDRAGSTWAAGLFHGGINAVGGLTVAMINPPNFPWAGIVGIGGFVALAIGLGAVVVIRARGSSDEPALQNSAPAA